MSWTQLRRLQLRAKALIFVDSRYQSQEKATAQRTIAVPFALPRPEASTKPASSRPVTSTHPPSTKQRRIASPAGSGSRKYQTRRPPSRSRSRWSSKALLSASRQSTSNSSLQNVHIAQPSPRSAAAALSKPSGSFPRPTKHRRGCGRRRAAAWDVIRVPTGTRPLRGVIRIARHGGGVCILKTRHFREPSRVAARSSVIAPPRRLPTAAPAPASVYGSG